MIVIYGWRHMGKVEEVDGQYALTKFFHLFWLPIVPLSSMWIVDPHRKTGHEIKVHSGSVAAAYARWWGLVGGLVFLAIAAALPDVQTVVFCTLAAAGLFALAARSWRSRAPSAEARKRSDANLAAFNTRCDPRWFMDPHANELRSAVARAWGEASEGKTPSDVARFGATDGRQATLAYALLRLSAVTLTGTAAAEAEADARRIVDNVRELAPADPYRTAVAPARVEPATEPPSTEQVEKLRAMHEAESRVAGRVIEGLDAELRGDKFERVAVRGIELVLKKKGLTNRYAIVVLRAPEDGRGLAIATPQVASYVAGQVGLATLFVVWIGSGITNRVAQLEHGIFSDNGLSVRGIFAIDAATGTITSELPKVSETTANLRERVAKVVGDAVKSVN